MLNNPDKTQHLKEHDIDLLLLKELDTSAGFRQWFVEQINGAEFRIGDFKKVAHSVSIFKGESDLELTVTDSANQYWMFLIENKINAALQRKQAKRYRERGDYYQNQKEPKCDKAVTVITAPRRYFGLGNSKKGFDATITYEAIREWLASNVPSNIAGEELTAYNYNVDLLTSAIENLGNKDVTEFWEKYWEMAQQYIPTLQMTEPGHKPADANFIEFKPAHWPKEVLICHKLGYGCVDLQFRGYGEDEHTTRLRTLFEKKIHRGMAFVKTHKSGVIRLTVPEIDATKSFDEQVKEVRLGMLTAQHLYNWFESQLPNWKQLVTAQSPGQAE